MGDTKMALSRPLLNFARKFSTSSIQSSGAHGDHGTKQWKLGTYLVAVPVVVLATLYNFAMEHEHPHRPEFAKYEYMRTRNKCDQDPPILQPVQGGRRHQVCHSPRGQEPEEGGRQTLHQSPQDPAPRHSRAPPAPPTPSIPQAQKDRGSEGPGRGVQGHPRQAPGREEGEGRRRKGEAHRRPRLSARSTTPSCSHCLSSRER